MNKHLTIQEFFRKYPDDETCLQHIFNVKYGQDYECPRCNKKVRWYRIKAERAYSCGNCGNHLHPTVGTPFEASRTSLQLWFYAIYLFTNTRHGVSAKELERTLGVTYKCAWRMGHEIRKYMADIDGEEALDGKVEVDETYIGGKRQGSRGRGAKGKTIVFGMVERGGKVMTKIVQDVKKTTLEPIIEENVVCDSTIYSDELRSYSGLENAGYKHYTVNHRLGEYVRNNAHTNTLEGYWSYLKKSISSTHIHVSGKHLEKYTKEFEYRYNCRNRYHTMFDELIAGF